MMCLQETHKPTVRWGIRRWPTLASSWNRSRKIPAWLIGMPDAILVTSITLKATKVSLIGSFQAAGKKGKAFREHGSK